MNDVSARLAVIESRLEDLLGHVLEIRAFVPERIVEQAGRLTNVEKALRSIVWGIAAVGSGLLTAFLAHVFGQ